MSPSLSTFLFPMTPASLSPASVTFSSIPVLKSETGPFMKFPLLWDLFIFGLSSLYIRLHVCESVSPPGHLVPGTN